MKCFIPLCLALFVGFSTANAQIQTLKGKELSQALENLGSSAVFAPQLDTYIGSPYFTEWSKGYLVLSNEKKTVDMMLRLDMTNNSILFIRNDEVYAIPGKKVSKYVIYTSDGNISFRNGLSSQKHDITSNTLLHVIYDGQVKLLAHYTSILMENVPAYGVAGNVNEYQNDTDYFLVTPDGIFHETDLDEDNILEILPGKNKKLQAFAENRNLDYDKVKELYKILAHYDLLLKARLKN